jgi:hypothetical protein
MTRLTSILTVAMFCLLYFSSCQKSDLKTVEPASAVATTTTVNMDLITEVENLPRSVVSLGYNKLNSSEKVLFWQRHIDQYVKEHSDLSPEIKSQLLEMKKFVTTDLYDNIRKTETRKRIADFQREQYTIPVQQRKISANVLIDAATLVGAGKAEQTLTELQRTAVALATDNNCNCYYDISCSTGKYCFSNPVCSTGDDNPYNCGLFGTSRCSGICS